MMKLYHGSDLIGITREPTHDGLWMVSDVELTPAADQFKDLFAFVTDEEKMYEELPFDEKLLEDWTVEDENGTRKRVGLPGIHPDGEIYCRYYWALNPVQC